MKRLLVTLFIYLLTSGHSISGQTISSATKWMEYVEDMDIAPEDMSDQIDDLLNHELYEDDSAEENPQSLIKDDMEVNTMDM